MQWMKTNCKNFCSFQLSGEEAVDEKIYNIKNISTLYKKLVFDHGRDGVGPPHPETFFSVYEERVHLRGQFSFEITARLQQLLMLCLRLLQLLVELLDRRLQIFHLYDQPVHKICCRFALVGIIYKSYLFCAGSLQSSTSCRCALDSSLVWATFKGATLSIIAFRRSSMFFSTSNISRWICRRKCSIKLSP